MLEGAPCAMVLGSGMSAATAVFMALAPGDHVVAPIVMYWGLRVWLLNEAKAWGLRVDLVDATDPDAICAAIRPGETKLVWLETPANPLWSLTDIRAVAAMAHAAGALVAVDSTCATPLLTRPLELGADIVMHSATKYLNGHSDVMAGALVAARDDAFWARIKRVRATLGQILGPLEAYLLIRGMRTLDLRVRTACAGAMELATRLSNHAAVAGGFVSGARIASRPRGRAAADAGRVRRHALDPRARRRGGGDRDGCATCGCGSAPPRWAGWRA